MRKDVWRLRPGGEVKLQIRFGEFGGAYVNHCHNTAHEDFAMLLRMQVLAAHPDQGGTSPQYVITKTPIPTANGVLWKDPEILPKATRAPERWLAIPALADGAMGKLNYGEQEAHLCDCTFISRIATAKFSTIRAWS